MYIYEIGCITYFYNADKPECAKEWRHDLDVWCADCGIKTFNPTITYDKEMNHFYDSKMCVDQNDYFLNKCDIAVVNLEEIVHSPGSIYELTTMKKQGKPVIAFGERNFINPHIESCISQFCETLDDVKELITNMFI
jgi:nucleoside 2-deoxyribosyltransferase